MAHFALGRMHVYSGEIEMGLGEMQSAIAINPNFARGYFGLGWAHVYGAGRADQALATPDAALRLSPRDPWRWLTLFIKGFSLHLLGRHDEAVAHCRQACRFTDAGFLPYTYLAAALAGAGQKGAARAVVEKARDIEPTLSIGFMRERSVGMHESTLKGILDSLRNAGVPE